MNCSFSDRELLLFEPRQAVLEKIAFPENEPEMAEFESTFLCGSIREKKSKKIVGLGVAAGGTRAIILECLSQLSMNETTKLYSYDSYLQLYEKCYFANLV